MLSKRIKSLRLNNGMTQKELSDKLNLTPKMISFYELGDRVPPPDILEKLADIFVVTTDYLLCRTGWIQCPICYNTYDPLNKYDTAEHNIFHKKFIDAENKYGKILLYSDACAKRERCIVNFRNPQLSFDSRIDALDNYLKYNFMISIWESGFNLNHQDFDSYCQEELQKLQPDELIPEKLCTTIREKYKVLPSKKIIQITAKDNRDIKKDLDRIMEQLANQEIGPAAYDGEVLDPEAAELFREELEIALKRLKIINKEKYNPYKNKK